MNFSVLFAIFRRNFVSYFLNPTGYVFICVFVLLSSLAAFWPNEFFTANLANLDQLNRYFPLIMLIFIPAITMSVWAEERRQGTDELLLTIPATDVDVVMGKYLSCVAIYCTSLLFSLVCNFTILRSLGEPDLGLFFSTYLGYLMVGLAMLSIGMVASFLTSNITVGFVLGAVFCAIPIGLDYAGVILPADWAIAVTRFGVAKQLLDYTQGVWSLSSFAYFASIIVIMLYLSVVLIGRRHWVGGRDGQSLGLHYFVRVVSLIATAAGLVLLTFIFPARADLTSENLNTLTKSTRDIVGNLDSNRPIKIEAFVSPNPPKEYVPLRDDLVRQLREIAARGGSKVSLKINDTLPYTDEADRAEKVFGIKGRDVYAKVRGQDSTENIFLGVAITSGLDRTVIPFFDGATPIEYELVHAIAMLNGSSRKRLGLFIGDKTAFQEPDRQTGRMRDPQIVEELRKQYEVVDLDAAKPVPDNIDVLLAVQPTVMQPKQVENLVAAVRSGVPTLIFQDPSIHSFPQLAQQEHQLNQMPFVQDSDTKQLWSLLGVESNMNQIVTQEYNALGRRQQMPPGIVFAADAALGRKTNESVFDRKDPITAKSELLVFIFGGWVSKLKDVDLTFTPLVHTSTASGYIDRTDAFVQGMMGEELNPNPKRHRTGLEYAMAARIRGKPAPEKPATTGPTVDIKRLADEIPAVSGGDKPTAPEKNELLLAQAPAATPTATAKPSATAGPSASAAPSPSATAAPSATAKPSASPSGTAPVMVVNPYVAPSASATGSAPAASASPSAAPTATASGTGDAVAEKKKDRPMDVVLIMDIDFIGSQFFLFRDQRVVDRREWGDEDNRYNFDNVTIVLNALDSLAGDDRFIEVRTRRPTNRTLTTLDDINIRAAEARNQQVLDKQREMEEGVAKEEARLNEELKKLRDNTTLKRMDKENQLRIFSAEQARRLEATRTRLQQALDRETKELARNQNEEIRGRQDLYKALAVFVPPIFPLLIGLVVFFSRRAGEQEGVDRARLR